MKESTRLTNDIRYLLHEAVKGDAKSAFYAAHTLEDMGYHPFLVQAQYRRSAELGYPAAQRWLGILGLCHQLQTEGCSYSNVTYYDDYDKALCWLQRAASENDPLSRYILAKCRQSGIGMDADIEGGEAEMRNVLAFISEDEVTAVSLLFEYIKLTGRRETANEYRPMVSRSFMELAV